MNGWVEKQENKKTKFMSYQSFDTFMNQQRRTKFKMDQVLSYLDGCIATKNKKMEIALSPEEGDQAMNASTV